MLDIFLESTSFLEKIKQKIFILSNISAPYPKKSVAPSEKVALSEEVEKGSGPLDYIEEPVVTIHQKDLKNKIEKENITKYQLQGRFARLTQWFGLDHEWLEETFCAREPDFYKQLYKMNTGFQDMETYQIFLFSMVNNKTTEEIELKECNDSVKPYIKKKSKE